MQRASAKLLRRRGGGGYWILAVKFIDESLGDVDAVGCINEWNPCTVDYQVNVACFRKCLESSADFFLQRGKEFCATPIVSILRILTFTLNVPLQLVQLILLCLKRLRVDWCALRCVAEFSYF